MKQKILCLVIAAAAVLLPAVSAQAGDINANEQGVISAVSQSFSYNGGTYVVKDAYIEQGRAKLAEDGVNLTASEAAGYISQFHGSYQELVEEGYCVQISAPSNDPDDVEEPHSDEESKVNRTVLKKILGESDTSKNHKKDKTSTQEIGEDSSSGEGKSSISSATPTPAPVTQDDWSREEDLGTTMNFEDKDRSNAKEQKVTVNAGGNDVTIVRTENSSSKDSAKEDDKKTKTEGNVLSELMHFGIWKTVYIVLVCITVFTLIFSVYYILKVKRHKRKRRRVRKWIAIAMGVCFGGWTLALLFVLGCYFGVYSNTVIQRQMMESDYFLGVTQMTREIAQDQLEAEGYSKDIATEVFSLSSVYIEEKQFIRNLLLGNEDAEVSTEGIHDTLETEIVGDDAEKNKAMVETLEQTYVDMLQFEIGTVIHDSRVEFMFWFRLFGISAVVVMIIIFFTLYGMYDYLHKSARVCSYALLVASVLVTGLAVAARLLNLPELITANPVYFQEFLQNYASWDITVFIYMGFIGILAAIGLFIWKNYLHMIYAE